MSEKTLPERLAVIESQQENMYRSVGELTTEVKALTAALNRARGGWLALVSLTSLAGIVGGLIAKIITK